MENFEDFPFTEISLSRLFDANRTNGSTGFNDLNDLFFTNIGKPNKVLGVLQRVLQVFLGAVFVAGLGNVYLAVAMIRGRLFKDAVTRIIVFNLTLANTSFLLPLPVLITSMATRQWKLGPFLCKLYWLSEQGNKYSSIVFLTYLCCDWFIAVVLVNRATSLLRLKRCLIAAALCWVTIFTTLSPVIAYAELKGEKCSIFWPSRNATNLQLQPFTVQQIYFIVTVIFFFFIPSVIIVLLNSIVVVRLRRVSKRVNLRTSIDAGGPSSQHQAGRASSQQYQRGYGPGPASHRHQQSDVGSRGWVTTPPKAATSGYETQCDAQGGLKVPNNHQQHWQQSESQSQLISGCHSSPTTFEHGEKSSCISHNFGSPQSSPLSIVQNPLNRTLSGSLHGQHGQNRRLSRFQGVFSRRRTRSNVGLGQVNGHRKYRRTTIIIFLVSFSHILMWSPFWFTSVFFITCRVIPTENLILWMQLVNILPYVNSAAFPYFYLFVKSGDRRGSASLRHNGVPGTAV